LIRGIDALDFSRLASIHNELREGTVPAANVYPAQPRGWREPFDEGLAREPAPGAHPLVGGAILEADLPSAIDIYSPSQLPRPEPRSLFLLAQRALRHAHMRPSSIFLSGNRTNLSCKISQLGTWLRLRPS
jgi:hypothetical protein